MSAIPHAYFEKVVKHFFGDVSKAYTWFTSKHPALGTSTPLEMLRDGKHLKVIKYIVKEMK